MLPFSKRLDEIYGILTDAEKRDLGRFLSSPYFTRDKSLVLLHEFMHKEQDEEKRNDKKMAWQGAFQKKPYNEAKFRYMVSDLIAATEDFIYLQHTLKSKPGFVHVLNDYYTLREAEENQASLATKIVKRNAVAKGVVAPNDYLEQHFKNELIGELHSTSLKTYQKYIRENKTDSASGLDIYYVIEKLRQMCIAANDNNVFGTKSSCFRESDVLQLSSAAPFSDNEFVHAYHCVYLMLTNKTEEPYFELKQIIDQHGYEMDDSNLSEIFTYARNFCIGQVNTGNHQFFEELFDLYEQGLKKRILLPNGEINERNFKNIVTTALRTKKAKWAHEFIEQYHYSLNKTVRANAYGYNLANYYFHTKQYDKALLNLQKVQLSDLFYGLDARSLMIKCYYELDEREAFINAYFSFRMFVQRRKNVSEQHRKNYLNFLRITKKLINLRPRDKASITSLQQEIKSAKALADKSWLEEKLKMFVKKE